MPKAQALATPTPSCNSVDPVFVPLSLGFTRLRNQFIWRRS